MTTGGSRRPNASGEETRDALADVLRDQAERTKRYGATDGTKERSPLPARIAAVVLIPLTIWVWLAPPALLRPTPVPPPPRSVEAGASMDLYVAALEVNRYLEVNGHLPATLTDALQKGDDGGGVVYEILDRTRYRLSTSRPQGVTTYESTEDLSALIRRARTVLGGNQ